MQGAEIIMALGIIGWVIIAMVAIIKDRPFKGKIGSHGAKVETKGSEDNAENDAEDDTEKSNQSEGDKNEQ